MEVRVAPPLLPVCFNCFTQHVATIKVPVRVMSSASRDVTPLPADQKLLRRQNLGQSLDFSVSVWSVRIFSDGYFMLKIFSFSIKGLNCIKLTCSSKVSAERFPKTKFTMIEEGEKWWESKRIKEIRAHDHQPFYFIHTCRIFSFLYTIWILSAG